MDTGVRDLQVACFKDNSTWINGIGSKDLSSRPIYAVLSTHSLIITQAVSLGLVFGFLFFCVQSQIAIWSLQRMRH